MNVHAQSRFEQFKQPKRFWQRGVNFYETMLLAGGALAAGGVGGYLFDRLNQHQNGRTPLGIAIGATALGVTGHLMSRQESRRLAAEVPATAETTYFDPQEMSDFGYDPDNEHDREEWLKTTPPEGTPAIADWPRDAFEFGGQPVADTNTSAQAGQQG